MIGTAIASLYISFQLFHDRETIPRAGFAVIFIVVMLAPASMLLPIETSYLIIKILFSAIIIYRIILCLKNLKTSSSRLFLAGTVLMLCCAIIFETNSSVILWLITGAVLEMIFTSFVIGLKIKSSIEYNALHTLENFHTSNDEIQITNEGQNVLTPEIIDEHDRLIIQNLTVRETEVLALLAEGLKDHELALKLNLSVPTVKTHLRNLYSKLEVRSRTEACIKYNNLMGMAK